VREQVTQAIAPLPEAAAAAIQPVVSRRSTRAWAPFALPGVAWLLAFFVLPVYAVMAVAFGSVDPILRITDPEWNPLAWDLAAFKEVIDRALDSEQLRPVFVRTGWYVLLAVAGCIALGYPIAYFVARKAGRSRGLVLALLVLPFWISYLMRMLAWTNLLQPDGYVNDVSSWFGGPADRNWLDGSWSTVVIGLVYGYVPFFILPLYAALERIDGRLIEAGRDLGASRLWTFLKITLPLSVPGLMAASVITVLPMCGDYYTNSILSESPRTTMVGNQIVESLSQGTQPQQGASLVLILMALLAVLMIYYLVSVARQQRNAAS
jgi:ABC-type spermidine/putrescine transport system permease subunit I